MSNREKFKDNPLSKVCTTIYFYNCKPEEKRAKISEYVPFDELYGYLQNIDENDATIAIKIYKIPVKDRVTYFEIYGISIRSDYERNEIINWVLNIGNGESIVDDGDEYLLEMELLSWLLYEGYSIP